MDKELLARRVGELPAWSIADALSKTLREQQNVVITAPPGAGKSTLLPLSLMLDAPVEGRILMLEPRRLAARQIAERMASLLGEKVGERVGYRIRFETCIGPDTKIEVLTEGILTRMLERDPTLDGVGILIFDEFHERSLHSDLALALARQVQALVRPDLRLLLMSATIDASAICAALDAPHLTCQGRMFPVKIDYAEQDVRPEGMAGAVASAVRKALPEGDILAFLPGQAEILRVAELLEGIDASIFPLYGNLSPAEQRCAIVPQEGRDAAGRGPRRRVVLATSIAETSLTIEGIRVVIDSGLCRTLAFDQRTGMSHLQTVQVSLDMAKQRAGRAGRLAPGICHRMWTKPAEHRMADRRRPELEYADLSPMLLSVAAFGETDVLALPWLTPPPVQSVVAARQLLLSLGAIDEKGVITGLGRQMSALPCHPRISRMILRAAALGQTSLACDIAALLEEKDPLAGEDCDSDLSHRICLLRRGRRRGSVGRFGRIQQVASAYLRMMKARQDDQDVATEEVGRLVAYAYPERVAMQMDRAGRFRLATGEDVRLGQNDPLSAYPWLAIAALNSPSAHGERGTGMGTVFLAAAVEPDDLEELAWERALVAWDAASEQLLEQREWRIGRLLLRSKPLPSASREEQERVLLDAVEKDGLSLLSWTDEVGALQRRMAWLAARRPELGIPDLSLSISSRRAGSGCLSICTTTQAVCAPPARRSGRLTFARPSGRSSPSTSSSRPTALLPRISRCPRAAISAWTTAREPMRPC